jgi:hypothetical protein
MKAYGRVNVRIYVFLTSALDGGEWSASRPGRFTPGKSPRYPLDKKLDGTRTSLEEVKKRKILPPPGLELHLLGRPAGSQSLYRLRYPGSEQTNMPKTYYVQGILGIKHMLKN